MRGCAWSDGNPERRRRWRDDEKLAILEEAFAPGACVSEVARHWEDLSSLIYIWRRNARAQTGERAFVEAVVADGGSRPPCASATPSCGPDP